MKRERIQKKDHRPRDRQVDLPPLTIREVFFPYPIRRDDRVNRPR